MRTTRLLVEMALTIALAFVLDELKLFQMPQGGTVSLGMLPIIVLALLRGPVAGVTAGALFGVLDVLTPPTYIVHPVQLILDYPLPYALVGLAGLMRPTWSRLATSGKMAAALWAGVIPAVLIAALGRYASHLVSGAIFFGEYAPDGQPVWLYSALYNLYVPVSAALCLGVAAIVLPALAKAPGLVSAPSEDS